MATISNNTANSVKKREVDYLFDKTVECEVCGRTFKTRQMRTGKARFIGTDDILKPMYEGIDACKYDIILCPFCGYAASQRNYGHLTPKKRQAIRENIEPKFNVKWKEDETYTYEMAIKRCKMAVLTEMVTGGKVSESAYLCLKLAWLYRGQIDEFLRHNVPEEFVMMYRRYEKEYIEDAYKGFKEAVATEYPPIAGMDEMTITFLLMSLAIKCNELDDAKRFGSQILGSRSANSKLKDKTRELLDEVRNS